MKKITLKNLIVSVENKVIIQVTIRKYNQIIPVRKQKLAFSDWVEKMRREFKIGGN